MKCKYTITGLDCPNCAAKLAAQIEAKDGIDAAKINFLTEKVTVETTLTEEQAFDLVCTCAAAFSKSVKIAR